MWRVIFLDNNKHKDFRTLEEAEAYCHTLDYEKCGNVVIKALNETM